MKFGNFLFPDCRDPARDGVVIDEALREAWLSDELGVDVIWLAEHHFDGICAYVDPISFAGALATSTRRSKIGFAVVQTALHHPVRLAEQLAVLDNITKGRLIVGLGRGSSYNIYDYQGFGIDHHEAQERLEEAENILVTAWTGEAFRHHGKFWHLDVPMLRPTAVYKATSGADPRRFGRSLDARARPPGPAVPDERAVDGSDAPARRRSTAGRCARRATARSGSRAPLRSAGCGGMCLSPRPMPKPSASVCRCFGRWSRRGRRCATASFARPACASRCPRAICPPPAPRSSTASSTARRRASPKRWRISTGSASAASSRPSASDRCRTRRRPVVSGCSWSRSHRKFATIGRADAELIRKNPRPLAVFPVLEMRRPGAEEARFEDGDEILMHVKILRAGRLGRLPEARAFCRRRSIRRYRRAAPAEHGRQRREGPRSSRTPRCPPPASRVSGRCRCRCRSDAPCSRPALLRAPPIRQHSSRDRPATGPYAR